MAVLTQAEYKSVNNLIIMLVAPINCVFIWERMHDLRHQFEIKLIGERRFIGQ
jgi:hypothetical protein